MVSALKNKAGKAIECDTVGGDATLHGVTREGLEQRAGRSEGVSHADNWGKGLLDRLSRAKGLGWECAWHDRSTAEEPQWFLASPGHVLWHLTDGAVT